MAKTAYLSCVAACVVASLARGEPPRLSGVTAEFYFAQCIDETTVELRTNARRIVGENAGETDESDRPTRLKLVPEESTVRCPLADLDVSTVGGKKLDGDEVVRRLKSPTAVLMCSPGGEIPHAFRELFKNDVLFLQIRPAGRGGAGAAVPAPPRTTLVPVQSTLPDGTTVIKYVQMNVGPAPAATPAVSSPPLKQPRGAVGDGMTNPQGWGADPTLPKPIIRVPSTAVPLVVPPSAEDKDREPSDAADSRRRPEE